MKTRYFANTLGVFEGGGVRAAAFAGAYAEAIARGLRFNAVAGTSAGSIVAALIAAGAPPEFVLEELAKTSFGDLLCASKETDRPFEHPSRLVSMGKVLPGALGSIATIVRDGGLHSSVRIERWIEDLLRRSLILWGAPPVGDRVTFADLILPVFIVSADLAAAKPKVWSKSTTPNESVAVAVRCSSSIPFFFQPVRSGGVLHVDGGVISNLPSYVFAEVQASAARFSERVLTFRLRSSGKSNIEFSGFGAFARAIADALVSGGTAVQLRLQPNVYSLQIDTGDIKSTDFDKLDAAAQERLINNGRSAVRAFVENEQLMMSAVNETRTYGGYDERMLAYVHLLQRASRSAFFVDRSSYFLFLIFPALLASARRGLVLRYICEATTNPDEAKRRTTLKGLGFEIVEVSELPFTGLLIDANHDFAAAAVSSVGGQVGTDFDYKMGETQVYTAALDAGVFSVLRRVATHNGSASLSVQTPLRLQTVPNERLFAMLRQVPQYADAQFDLIDLCIDNQLQSMQGEIKEFKLLQIADLAEQFRRESVGLFSPMYAVLRNGLESLITPPIVEQVGASLVLIEGHSRAYFCMSEGLTSMRALRVRGVREPLPGMPHRFVDARVSSKTLPSDQLFKSFDRSRFREIEKFVRE